MWPARFPEGPCKVATSPRPLYITDHGRLGRPAWSECVGTAGYDYTHPDQIEDDLKERFDAITQGADPLTLTGSAQEGLVQLQGEEKSVA